VSGLYLYAVLAGAPAGEAPLGLAGEPLQFLDCGPLVAAVGAFESPPAPTAEALRGHDRTVRRLAEGVPGLLPARFGQWRSDGERLAESLRSREDALQAALRRVENRVQMTLRVFAAPASPAGVPASDPSPGAPAAASGTEYLAARRLELLRSAELPEVAGLRAALRPLVDAERCERASRPPLLGSVYHLVERRRVAEYLRILDAARPAGLTVGASGPWAPYAFAPEILG
jgi:hypothetical protein